MRPPDLVLTVFTEDGAVNLQGAAPPASGRRQASSCGRRPKTGGSARRARPRPSSVCLHACAFGLAPGDLSSVRSFLGYYWERSSRRPGAWRGGSAETRPMPWYVMAWDGTRTSGYGVATGPRAFGFGIRGSLRSHVVGGRAKRRGGAVQLGEREVECVRGPCAAGCRRGSRRFVATRESLPAPPARLLSCPICWSSGPTTGTTPTATAIRTFCCRRPRSSRRSRPAAITGWWSVVDDGWSPDGVEKGMWNRGNARFGDMETFARRLRTPGAATRHLVSVRCWPRHRDRQRSACLRDARFLDPQPGRRPGDCGGGHAPACAPGGYRLIKHDYSSFGHHGPVGLRHGCPPSTPDDWHFADRTRTTAEHPCFSSTARLRDAAGRTRHPPSAATRSVIFRLACSRSSRIGDDVSGRAWDRTRPDGRGHTGLPRRAPRHVLRPADPDIAPITARASVGQGPATAAPPRRQWYAAVRLAQLVAR